MTEKELHKLTRQDLLELLLAQSKEVARQQAELQSMEATRVQLQADFAQLKEKLNDKDVQLERLKAKLDQKDRAIAEQEKRLEEWRKGKRSELEEQVDRIRASARNMKQSLQEKDDQIRELKRQLTQQRAEAAQVVQMPVVREKKPEQPPAPRYETDYLLDALSEREQRIQELNRQLRQKEATLQSGGQAFNLGARPLSQGKRDRLLELLEAMQEMLGEE
ncbi:MAG: hypothetical protein J5927_06705 [Oscillospiraceae bacterium]|nr:hypothetical protein [Oscillospiraceae bacterium]